MGTDKATMRHPDGRSLVRRAVDLLAGAGCNHVVVSLRHDQDVPDEIKSINGPNAISIIRDPEGGSDGPLSGMLTSMRLHPQADWLVIACDLPRLDVYTLRHLVEAKAPGAPFVCYRSEFDGMPEPLCALYTADALPVLETAVAGDIRCPRKILIRQSAPMIELQVPGALANANTPDEWNQALLP
jgi:molybdopterin-guanine dinucleotide biosynthesis protein A